jgi:hypothetical protein
VKLPINIVSDPVSVHPPVMRQIPVGPELDAAVARAVGYDLPSYQDGRCSACDREYGWRPSIDLNAAFEAADKAGLFDNVNRRFSKEGGREGGWVVAEIVSMAGDEMDIAFGSTPAEAICRAILALKGAE